ncbi:MAG: hypothetical protein U0995_09630, partial [Erythrobacter sp.]|nr:hypothetical protein [Erythrobacter sp.]MDZ4273246.1 hypothetical protein [Erythrobacter sp.]MDZ4276288.1 hypothetical protein [Erythrobacter sp.]
MTNKISAVITKPPTAERFHSINIAPFMVEGELVTDYTVVASGPALLIDMVTAPSGLIRWRVREGINDLDYIVTVTITTDTGRKEPVFI